MTHLNQGSQPYDVFVLGGGINGVGIAADSASRGLSVVLCEQHDLASATSSASTKLIHGGLRYLEYYEFRLVREALSEREILMNNAPHLITPLQFIMPHHRALRPYWLIRLGLFLYDHLGKRQRLRSSAGVNLSHSIFGKPLKPSFKKGFSYYDCWADDARLVIANAKAARAHGATILTNHRVQCATQQNGLWQISVENKQQNQTRLFHARALVNAAGPWLNTSLDYIPNRIRARVQLVRGSHIVVNKLYDGEHAYILQQDDKRIIFAIPFADNYTLIGTTDINGGSAYVKPEISHEEITYLCAAINQYFNQPITSRDIVWSYSGVRPLQADDHDNPSKITRDYRIEVDALPNAAPLLTIFGGKLTTYRKLSEQAVNRLHAYFPDLGDSTTEKSTLPGGHIPNSDMHAFIKHQQLMYSWLPETLLTRLAHTYGSEMNAVLAQAQSMTDLGLHFGCGLYQQEVDYLCHHEWAQFVDDILWRRTKLGLVFSADQVQKLANYLRE